jgi:hypothetical protein
MKIYKHWATEKQTILVDGVELTLTCNSGSNISVEDAQRKAKEKAEKIKHKIKGEKHLFDQRECRNFNTCRFIEQVGARHSLNDAIQLHDEITGATFRQLLA